MVVMRTGITERALLLGRTHPLVGVVTDPPPQSKAETRSSAIILLNSGIVHRVGSGRLYVKIARRMAALGVVVVRFDHSGIGDSSARPDCLPFVESNVKEAQEVIDDLVSQFGIEQFVLGGICSGADTAFRMVCTDDRVVGAVMMNASFYDNSSEWNMYVLNYSHNRKWARQYWKGSLFRPNSWRRALTGRIQYRRLLTVLAGQLKYALRLRKGVGSLAKCMDADVRSLIEKRKRLLLIHSEEDAGIYSLEVIFGRALQASMASGMLRREIIPQTDHTFTLLPSQERLIRIIEDWSTTTLKR